MATALIILAAGQGTRMRSALPKVLHRVGGQPLLCHALDGAAPLDPERTVVVAGVGAEAVEAAARAHSPEAVTLRQDEQLGTAHAVLQARPALEGFEGDALVLYGDTPFIRPETLERMIAARRAGHAVVVLGFEAARPGRYGRLVMAGETLSRIVEAKDATDEELSISLCNSGVVCADAATLMELAAAVGNDNASGEYYLTDIVALANARGLGCTAITCPEAETMGVNTRADLAGAEAVFQARARATAMAAGVTLTAPETVFLSHDTAISADTVIGPNVVIGPGVTIGEAAEIRAFCHLEGCRIGPGAQIGPFARLRPGAELAEGVHVGNFVEVKNTTLGPGAKANHLTYLGDASIGAGTNIGAGTITCNYDGVMKYRTEIGRDAFIGSDTMLVAPVRVGDRAMTATGAVITEDVPDEALAVARARQENKPGLAVRLMERLRAAKARDKG
ncbi:bifunctional UDP-N-acetylglucosamine diphosphorylase/glucosamine-1-phosphate N-acetyltransferase GlmU [Maritimibacter sp. 55A14]|uniref:bifunctional UDP-N-acetylglucosamine diphosphorylase/glucosamine-1-phosphate N-acetyltransferase GlmU n=1 Tax=Maritimibacter sp. 55A14 TaxID=2174844 RepID=UPI000D60A03E|nr:bifunctional UDP-N-acetylglucosamine diphosphorylase/glucosamine-1-phosphate N-acetyltransferase GlmU [Maritimibacter sp. 55A14]PWE33958.1 bifunctional UDP-N-acetylglucosamine diphosphorylase/glucosamine-1-phosphate N-acetyltransferase GlmU [Maritimibacter sp. 55A14]